MPPIAVPDQSTTTHTKINTASISNQSASTCSTDSHGVGVYQLTTVGASDETIHTLVSVTLNVPPYRKALID